MWTIVHGTQPALDFHLAQSSTARLEVKMLTACFQQRFTTWLLHGLRLVRMLLFQRTGKLLKLFTVYKIYFNRRHYHFASSPISGRAQWNPTSRVLASRKQPHTPHCASAGLKWSHSLQISIRRVFSASLTKTLSMIRLRTVAFGAGLFEPHPQFWVVSVNMQILNYF